MWRRARGVAPVTMIYNGVVCKPTGPADMWLHPQLQRVRRQLGSWHHLCRHGDASHFRFYSSHHYHTDASGLDTILTPPWSINGSIFRSSHRLHERALLTFAWLSGNRGHPQSGGPRVWSSLCTSGVSLSKFCSSDPLQVVDPVNTEHLEAEEQIIKK